MIAVISDTHNHNWSVFSHVLPNGHNSRLQNILDETWRAATTAKENGAVCLVHCGDMFHVRGSIAPSVLNPTVDLYRKIIIDLKLPVYVIAGNHDLEGNNSEALGNASEALKDAGVTVISNIFKNTANKRLFIPYHNSCNKLREVIKQEMPDDADQWTLFIHAPLNGVIAGIPDNGLSAEEVKEWGFKAVFCGHYHNHQVFDGNVCSVGSLTHQTFGDIGAKAGFLLFDKTITHYPSSAPRFVEFDPNWDELEMVEQLEGNFVRAQLENATNEEVEEVRKFLKDSGSCGINITHVPKTVTSREGMSVEAGKSVKIGLKEWCQSRDYSEKVIAMAQEIMDDVEAKSL